MYRKKLLFAGFGLLLFAIIYIVAGALSYIYILNKNASCTVETIGTVVINSKTTTKTRNKTTTKTNFVVSYEVDGKIYQSRYSGSTSKYEKGDKVEIKYNPSQPNIFTLKNDKLFQVIILIFIGIGLIVFVISIIVLKKGFQTRRDFFKKEDINMIGQIGDSYYFDGHHYMIIAMSKEMNFDPADYGLIPQSMCAINLSLENVVFIGFTLKNLKGWCYFGKKRISYFCVK